MYVDAEEIMAAVAALPTWRFLLSALYFVAGQALNIGIFMTLGKEGVRCSLP
jgi:hypothetical protein